MENKLSSIIDTYLSNLRNANAYFYENNCLKFAKIRVTVQA